jgi:hypothetical protein
LTRVSSFQNPVPLHCSRQLTHNECTPVATQMLRQHWPSLRHTTLLRCYSLLHSRICEYINIFSLVIIDTLQNSVNPQTTRHIIHQFLEIPPHIKVINAERTYSCLFYRESLELLIMEASPTINLNTPHTCCVHLCLKMWSLNAETLLEFYCLQTYIF